MNQKMKISQGAIDLLIDVEGIVLKPYLDSVSVPTIGIGSTMYCDGTKVTMKDKPITREVAQELLLCHLNSIVLPCILKNVKPNINQNMLDALSSLIYNIGCSAFSKSSVLRFINIEATPDIIKDAFEMWKMAGGKVLQGLVNRRKKEIALFYKPI